MKSSKNRFKTPKGCLSCSISLGNRFSPNWKQKQTHFFETKNGFFPFGKCRSAEKCKSGTLWDLLTYILFQNIKKTRRGTFETLKNFKKVAQCRKKIERDPLVLSDFVGYLKQVKNERGRLCTKFALAGLGLSSFK